MQSFASTNPDNIYIHGRCCSAGVLWQHFPLVFPIFQFLLSSFIHSFIHYGHFYSAPSGPLLLRGTPDYSTDTVSEFHAEAHRQLQVQDLPKVPMWRLEWESNPRPSG